jgi:high-affinity nickel permease
VAAMIGGVQVLGLLASKLNLTGMFWTKVQEMNDDLASSASSSSGYLR